MRRDAKTELISIAANVFVVVPAIATFFWWLWGG